MIGQTIKCWVNDKGELVIPWPKKIIWTEVKKLKSTPMVFKLMRRLRDE